jgi:hypothetical protein
MYKRIAIYVFITVSVVGCGDDAATRAENEALRARLENLEANQSGGDTHSEQASSQTESALSPEAVIRRYFDAKMWQDRLPFVAYPDRVEPLMREKYVSSWAVRTYSIDRAQEQGGGKWHVPFIEDPTGRGGRGAMVVIKTKDGNKVDWVASQKLCKDIYEEALRQADVAAKDAQRRFIAQWGLENAKLEVKVLKVYQSAGSTKFDLEVRNRSGAFIDFWGLDGVFYGSGDKYLGKSITNGQNLRPGDTVFDEIYCSDTNVSMIKSWKFKISRIRLSNDSGQSVDATRNFSIVVQ